MEIKVWIIEHWQLLLFFIALFLIALAITSMYIRKEMSDNLKKFDNKINSIDTELKTVIKNGVQEFIKIGRINHAVIKVIVNNCNDDDDFDKIAYSLYNDDYLTGVTPDEYSKYGFPDKVVIKLKQYYNKQESKKLKSKQTK